MRYLFMSFYLVLILPISTVISNAGGFIVPPEVIYDEYELAKRPLTKADINDYINKIDTKGFSKDLVKAIAWGESAWQQRMSKDEFTGDWGVMQINNRTIKYYKELDVNSELEWRVKNDTRYNISFGVRVLSDKRKYVRNLQKSKNWSNIEKKYNLYGMSELDMIILSYNGFQRNHAYVNYIKRILANKPWERSLRKPEKIFSVVAIQGSSNTVENEVSYLESMDVNHLYNTTLVGGVNSKWNQILKM